MLCINRESYYRSRKCIPSSNRFSYFKHPRHYLRQLAYIAFYQSGNLHSEHPILHPDSCDIRVTQTFDPQQRERERKENAFLL